MPKRTSYTPGTPCWVDLVAVDQEAAKSFYGPLFGWRFEDQPIPDGGVYSMAFCNDATVAAIASQPPGMREQDMPAMWNTYIAVDDVDAATARVGEAGGTVMMSPMDVMQAGRMAFVTDPTGAVVGLWQAREHIGATLVNEPGAFIWNELITTDPESAATFYNRVLGLTTEATSMQGQDYTLFKKGDDNIGGLMTPPEPRVPTHWHVYFCTRDTAASTAKCASLGGSVLMEPFDTPIGPMSVVADPQGASFSFFAPSEPSP